MGKNFAAGKKAFGFCDRCGRRWHLNDMKTEINNDIQTSVRVCTECYDPSQPQNSLNRIQTEDPQALQNPRVDRSFYSAGNDGAGGSRMIQWGWNPVGGVRDIGLGPNDLTTLSEVGTVTVVVV